MPKRNDPAAPVFTATLDWRAAWEEHRGWLRTVVWARLGESHAVEEVLQEVALAAASEKGLRTIRDVSKTGPWLYQVAIRQVLLHRRRLGRKRRLEENYAATAAAPEADGTHEPLGWLLAEEQRATVRQALDRLPRRDAEILLLKYTEDWTYRQLAEHLGISVSAIEARLHRARQRMRSTLAALDPTLRPKIQHAHA